MSYGKRVLGSEACYPVARLEADLAGITVLEGGEDFRCTVAEMYDGRLIFHLGEFQWWPESREFFVYMRSGVSATHAAALLATAVVTLQRLQMSEPSEWGSPVWESSQHVFGLKMRAWVAADVVVPDDLRLLPADAGPSS